ncbi:MAG: XRE family transcriptional regulator [Faecalibacterium prausnitzii]|jgi:transcriptional regulator with XRE-family HTH domain|nr:XRE family transcriptional regulator [Faecalibacterium prausnitzii]
MLFRAKEHFDAIGNYYHIIDPEGTLPEIERAKKEAEVLNDMPNSFPKALCYVMRLSGFTKEALAYESKVSESTIGRYRTGKVKHYSEKNVVALCVAMHLPPWLSFKLIGKAGFSLAATREQQAYLMVLSCMYMRSVDEVNDYLRERGSDLLSQVAA